MKWSELISPQAKEFNMRAMERVYKDRQEGKEIYPPDNLIYRAIELTPPDAVTEGSIIRELSAKKAFILSSHPSPFNASRPCRGTQPFRGSRPFSTANKLLMEMGGEPIEWKI